MDRYLAQPVHGVRSDHGESPVYDDRTDELLWFVTSLDP